jgi:transcriptional regulator with XRE-family HTH domain
MAKTSEEVTKMRSLRDKSGLSQQELADFSGVSRPMVSAVERGTKFPSVEVIKLLALGLDVPVRRVLNAVTADHGI